MPFKDFCALRADLGAIFSVPAAEAKMRGHASMTCKTDYHSGEQERYAAEQFRFLSNYDLVCKYHLSGERTFLGPRNFPRHCRFCKRQEPEASFSNRTHAVPEAFGNKSLFSNDECDDCNQTFGDGCEASFATYFQLYRTLARLPGKTGLIKMKDQSEDWRLEAQSGGIRVLLPKLADSTLVEHDPLSKRLIFRAKRGPHVPYEVYRCFLKIALSIMPNDQLQFFEEHFSWATCKPKNGIYVAPALVWQTLVHGPGAFGAPSVSLWRRKAEERQIPYMMGFVCVAKTIHQFFIPSIVKDAQCFGDILVRFPIMPPPWWAIRSGLSLDKLDLSEKLRVSGDVAEFLFHYEGHTITDIV